MRIKNISLLPLFALAIILLLLVTDYALLVIRHVVLKRMSISIRVRHCVSSQPMKS